MLLGQDQSCVTEQSQGQSLATAQHNQTKCPKPANKMMVNPGGQPQDQPNVHAVMMPMSQPVGGWHVTSMTKQSRPAKCPTIIKDNAVG